MISMTRSVRVLPLSVRRSAGRTEWISTVGPPSLRKTVGGASLSVITRPNNWA